MKTYPNLKTTKTAEIILLIGISLHILYVVAVVSGVWNDISNLFALLMAIATIIFVYAYFSIKKKPTVQTAIILMISSLFLTHYVVALLFIVSGILTIFVTRHNKNEIRKARVNL